ncbi:MAG: sulfotransferase [Woeseiaceae bacterium]|nr:sulfotransferase [Woeseiaceae bacterium]
MSGQLPTDYQATVNHIMGLLRQNRLDEAASACIALSKSYPQSNDALLLLGKTRQMQGRLDDMFQLVESALERDPNNIATQLQFAGACSSCGRHAEGLAQLRKIEKKARGNAVLLQHVAQNYTRTRKFEDAHRCFLEASSLDPQDPGALSSLASSCIAVGDLDKAETLFSKVIRLNSGNSDAWYNRSTLRKRSAEDNYVADLERALGELPAGDAGTVALCYALAKEHEDLGEDEACFEYLKRGADSYRRQISYDVNAEIGVMERIAQLFDRDYVARVEPAPPRSGPIFVLGLPRSGTTLVDRIISSHTDVTSMGEIPDFAIALTRTVNTSDRNRSLDASVNVDPDTLGLGYLENVAGYDPGTPYFIDKTPTNFLYVGLIAKALPGSRIIHVKRHPVDSCLSLYRALFRSAYLYSYELDELARYYIAYNRLMEHWHTILPGRIFDVAYEAIIADQESVSRELLDHCELAWQDECLTFDKNLAPVATASAAQVRSPLYRDALSRWRRFEAQLEPLITRLRNAGIEI